MDVSIAEVIVEAITLLWFGCLRTFETIIENPLIYRLRDKILQMNCLSSENPKEEINNSALSSFYALSPLKGVSSEAAGSF